MRDAARAYLRHGTVVARATVGAKRRETVIDSAALVNTSRSAVGSRLSGVVLETRSKGRRCQCSLPRRSNKGSCQDQAAGRLHGFQTFFEHHDQRTSSMFVAVSLLHCSNPQHLTGRTRPDPSRITLHVDGTPALANMRSITSASSECSARPVWMSCEPSAHIAGLPNFFTPTFTQTRAVLM